MEKSVHSRAEFSFARLRVTIGVKPKGTANVSRLEITTIIRVALLRAANSKIGSHIE